MRELFTGVMLLVVGAGCSSQPASPPDTVYEAPTAVVYPEGRFSGTWYQRSASRPCFDTLSISHDTLNRYNIYEIPCDTLYSMDVHTAYVTGDSLRIFAVPEHHTPELWLHLEQGRRLLLMTYQLIDFRNRPRPGLVRDTFWLDPAQMGR